MLMRKYVQEILGGDGELPRIEAGPALIYLVRRFGYTRYGGDGYKEVCNYYLNTAVEGLMLSLRITGVWCWLGAPMGKELSRAYDEEKGRPFAEWHERFRAWAVAQGHVLFVEYEFENRKRYQEEMEEWLREHAEQGVSDYGRWVKGENRRIQEMYEAVEPFPDRDMEFPADSLVGQCQAAIRAALVDLLRPVAVRDVFINVLGRVDDDSPHLGEYVEDEGFMGLVACSPMAGYGVVADVYEDADLYFDLMHRIQKLGQGNMVLGMRAAMGLLGGEDGD